VFPWRRYNAPTNTNSSNNATNQTGTGATRDARRLEKQALVQRRRQQMLGSEIQGLRTAGGETSGGEGGGGGGSGASFSQRLERGTNMMTLRSLMTSRRAAKKSSNSAADVQDCAEAGDKECAGEADKTECDFAAIMPSVEKICTCVVLLVSVCILRTLAGLAFLGCLHAKEVPTSFRFPAWEASPFVLSHSHNLSHLLALALVPHFGVRGWLLRFGGWIESSGLRVWGLGLSLALAWEEEKEGFFMEGGSSHSRVACASLLALSFESPLCPHF
jgi:hypothetical protein